MSPADGYHEGEPCRSISPYPTSPGFAMPWPGSKPAGPGGVRFESAGSIPATRLPPVRLGDGTLPLDDLLAGGLRRGALHEVVAHHKRDDAAAAGFALTVAGRCAGSSPLVWIIEDCAASETGSPYRPGLAAHGIDADRLILVRTKDARSTLWAVEEALKLRAPAVLAELWGTKHYGLAPSRRLLLAAQAGQGTAILLHTGLAGRGEALSSAAETRFAVAACQSPRLRLGGQPHACPRGRRRHGAAPQAAPRRRGS